MHVTTRTNPRLLSPPRLSSYSPFPHHHLPDPNLSPPTSAFRLTKINVLVFQVLCRNILFLGIDLCPILILMIVVYSLLSRVPSLHQFLPSYRYFPTPLWMASVLSSLHHPSLVPPFRLLLHYIPCRFVRTLRLYKLPFKYCSVG